MLRLCATCYACKIGNYTRSVRLLYSWWYHPFASIRPSDPHGDYNRINFFNGSSHRSGGIDALVIYGSPRTRPTELTVKTCLNTAHVSCRNSKYSNKLQDSGTLGVDINQLTSKINDGSDRSPLFPNAWNTR